MAKEAYYFSHDANASRDPKIMQLISVYGYEGYGWFWRLIEMMREQENYEISIKGKYAMQGLASTLQTSVPDISAFIDDCINEFGLFLTDGENLWSESLKRRMEQYKEKCEKRAEAGKKGAEARWGDSKRIAKPKQKHGKAIAKNGKGKESKGNKNKYLEYIYLTDKEYSKLIEKYGQDFTERCIEKLNNYIGAKGDTYKSHYHAILSWVAEDVAKKAGANNNGNGQTYQKPAYQYTPRETLR